MGSLKLWQFTVERTEDRVRFPMGLLSRARCWPEDVVEANSIGMANMGAGHNIQVTLQGLEEPHQFDDAWDMAGWRVIRSIQIEQVAR